MWSQRKSCPLLDLVALPFFDVAIHSGFFLAVLLSPKQMIMFWRFFAGLFILPVQDLT